MRCLALLLAVLLVPLAAGAEQAVGRVEAIYFEASPGVLLQRPLRAASARWADVDIGGRRVLARIPHGMRLVPGDRISLRLAEPRSAPLAQALPTTAVSRALAPEENASVGR